LQKPKIAVFKFASCSGCQLQIVNLESSLLDILGAVEISYFPMATRKVVAGPYDIGLVEGSVTREADVHELKKIREECKVLVAIGTCAIYGGLQALKNWRDLDDLKKRVYDRPDWITSAKTSTPISDHVKVDAALYGCPIGLDQLVELIVSALLGRKPYLPDWPVCLQCKMKGNVCLLVAGREPCMGPVTRGGCGAICPSWGRACFGCFGPCEDANPASMGRVLKDLGLDDAEVVRRFRYLASNAQAFREGAERYAG